MTPIPPVITGSHELVSWLNQVRRCLEERTPLSSVECPIDKLPSGFRPKPKAQARSSEVGMFIVEMVYRDYLVCQPVTLDENGGRIATISTRPISPLEPGLVRIAKPDELRFTGWDSNARSISGLTPEIDGYQYDVFPHGTALDTIKNPYDERTRTLLDGEEHLAESVTYTEETIWPKYITGHSVIFASKSTGGAIMTVTETEIEPIATLEQNEYAIEWVDLNLAGRTFQPKERKVKVCVSGQTGTWYVLIRASDAFQEEA